MRWPVLTLTCDHHALILALCFQHIKRRNNLGTQRVGLKPTFFQDYAGMTSQAAEFRQEKLEQGWAII